MAHRYDAPWQPARNKYQRVLFTILTALSYARHLMLGNYLAGKPKLMTASQGESSYTY